MKGTRKEKKEGKVQSAKCMGIIDKNKECREIGARHGK
jgi:hypothetical protein